MKYNRLISVSGAIIIIKIENCAYEWKNNVNATASIAAHTPPLIALLRPVRQTSITRMPGTRCMKNPSPEGVSNANIIRNPAYAKPIMDEMRRSLFSMSKLYYVKK
jgi:hypothetical protein